LPFPLTAELSKVHKQLQLNRGRWHLETQGRRCCQGQLPAENLNLIGLHRLHYWLRHVGLAHLEHLESSWKEMQNHSFQMFSTLLRPAGLSQPVWC
jgi:hypothetical protein